MSLPEEPRGAVLVLEKFPPTPDRDAGSLRLAHIMTSMRAEGYQLVLGTIHEGPDPRSVASLEAAGIPVLCGYAPVTKMLARLGHRFRCVWISRPETGAVFLPWVRLFCPAATVVYDTVDIHWLRFQRQRAFDPTVTQTVVDRQREEELACVRACDTTVVVTEPDRDELLRQEPAAHTAVVPNMHDVVAGVPVPATKADLVFLGGFDHAPNVDAVDYFLREVFPLVRHRLPGVRVQLIGSALPERVTVPASPDIWPVGYVPDLADWLPRCRVMIAPLRYGAGIKGKLGSALGVGLPVVTTSIGAEGMGLRHGRTALIADDPLHFAGEVVRLCRDDRLWAALSIEGRQLLAETLSPDAALPAIRQAMGVAA